jgi:prepilin-type N-terminal cleavage/methylation domain-containing protein/prepilin-type processing-associated H-X9-DG protein
MSAMRRSNGFTLIELLVVIAIIAILAAMLFPVFARARESARKIQCLSNVKNIAMAAQMYLNDYERFPPYEHRREVISFAETYAGQPNNTSCNDPKATAMNPYLSWPVLLDEYVRNRDVWQCPSAKLEGGAHWVNGDPNWFAHVQAMQGSWGGYGIWSRPCAGFVYPNGWGGTVTDGEVGLDVAGSFQWSIMCTDGNPEWEPFGRSRELNFSAIPDTTKWVVVGDRSSVNGSLENWAEQYAFPDVCSLRCFDACHPDGPCSDAASAGCYLTFAESKDPNQLKAKARHLGGVNLGFADGHAAWWSSLALMAQVGRGENCASAWVLPENGIQPIYYQGITSSDPQRVAACSSCPPLF